MRKEYNDRANFQRGPRKKIKIMLLYQAVGAINNIFPKEWDIIKSKINIWIMNNCIYHDIVPNFYYFNME